MTSTTTGSSVGKSSDPREQAAEVAGKASAAASDVAGTAKDQAANVMSAAADQTKNLVEQTGQQISSQAAEQTERLTTNIQQVAEHLRTMAQAGEPGSTAQGLVQDAADRIQRAATYLDGKQPGELLSDMQDLGRRKPGTFLLGAALAGIAVGRIAGAAKRSDSQPAASAPVPTTSAPIAAEPVTPFVPEAAPYPVTGAAATTPLR